MDWALTHLEGLKDICKHQVQINQPLPPDVLVEMGNITNIPSTSGSGTSSTTNKTDNVFTPEFLAKLEAISCLNECSEHGKCRNGRLTTLF